MENAEGLVVIGSSLTTYSGYRFCLWAQRQQKPIVIINQGSTRTDSMATRRTDEDCSLVLKTWFQQVN
jgi:NAD-dependent SIR2 family protein deacetylase